MKVLLAHNFYQQPGGEDQVFRSELALLESYGHKPVRFEMHNDDVQGMGKLSLLASTVWNRASASSMREIIRDKRIDVVHFHNTFPLISPSCYFAARDEGAAVVQTLHNFRFLCPGANFFRDGKVCEKCLGKSIPLPGVIHGCYRGSRTTTAAVATMITAHRAMGTYRDAVDVYIALTESAKAKFIAGGLPAEKIIVKPNFVEPDPGIGPGALPGSTLPGAAYALFVGRLSYEKGLETLLEAWETLGSTIPLKIVGDGPLADKVQEAVGRCRGIEWLGHKSGREVYDLIGRAQMLIFPSRCYETFGRVGIEAFAKGTPVIASNHGAMADVVKHEKTGFLFTPGDATALAAAVRRLLAEPVMAARMRTNGRQEYESKYTGARNYEMLMSIYERALARQEERAVSPIARRVSSSVVDM